MKKVTFLCLASAVLLGATTVLLGADVDRLVVLGGKTYLNGTLGDGGARGRGRAANSTVWVRDQ